MSKVLRCFDPNRICCRGEHREENVLLALKNNTLRQCPAYAWTWPTHWWEAVTGVSAAPLQPTSSPGHSSGDYWLVLLWFAKRMFTIRAVLLCINVAYGVYQRSYCQGTLPYTSVHVDKRPTPSLKVVWASHSFWPKMVS